MRGATLKDFTFQDLRHILASYLAISGATLAELAEAMGHKTLAMVKRYAHLTEDCTRGAVERGEIPVIEIPVTPQASRPPAVEPKARGQPP